MTGRRTAGVPACAPARYARAVPRLDDAALDALAALARLDLAPADRDGLRHDLQRILDYVDRLAAADDPSVPPLRWPRPGAAEVEPGDLRSDVERPPPRSARAPADGSASQLADLATAWRDGRFEVPRTVDADG